MVNVNKKSVLKRGADKIGMETVGGKVGWTMIAGGSASIVFSVKYVLDKVSLLSETEIFKPDIGLGKFDLINPEFQNVFNDLTSHFSDVVIYSIAGYVFIKIGSKLVKKAMGKYKTRNQARKEFKKLIKEEEFQELLGEYVGKAIDAGQFSVGTDGIVRRVDSNTLSVEQLNQVQTAINDTRNS